MTYEEKVSAALDRAERPVTLEEMLVDNDELIGLVSMPTAGEFRTAKYNPDQPRAPKGSDNGGQWVDDAGNTFTDADLDMGADIDVAVGKLRRVQPKAAAPPAPTEKPYTRATEEEMEAVDEDPSLMTAEMAAELYAANLDMASVIGEASTEYIHSGRPNYDDTYNAAAARLVDRIRKEPPTNKVLHRGLGSTGPIDRLENLRVGHTMTIDRVSSFSESESKAMDYAKYQGSVTYRLELRGMSRTFATDKYTGMTHREHLAHGKFRVVKIAGRVITLEQEATF